MVSSWVGFCLFGFVGCLTRVYSLSLGSTQRHMGIVSLLKTNGIALFQECDKYDRGPTATHSVNYWSKIFQIIVFPYFCTTEI